jgi:non-heme Fe2+,alpha-ketoglutarate-dependent halogenase
MPLDMSEMRTRYDRDGFVYPIDIMSPEDAANYRKQLEDAEAQYRDQKEFRQALRRYPNLVLPFVDEITRRPEVTEPIAEILGPNLLVLDAPFFIKEANTTSYVSWHQDLHYWGLEGDDEVTAWVALSPATRESGCMRFVAGSQNQIVDHQDTFADDNLLSRGQEIAVEVDDSEATDAELQPGQMSLHHGRVFHASDPNTTNDRRIGLAIRFIPTHAKQAPGGNMAAMLVRGVDEYGHFRQCTPPDGLMSDAALAHWRDIAGARIAVMMGDKKS